MIRITVQLDASLSAREATGEYDRTREPPSDEEALAAIKEALHEKGPARFLEDYGLVDDLEIDLRIE